MTGRGRPLRFLLAIAVGWTGGRLAVLWPRIDSVPALIDALVPKASAADMVRLRTTRMGPSERPTSRRSLVSETRPARVTVPSLPIAGTAPFQHVSVAASQASPQLTPSDPAGLPRPLPGRSRPVVASRWSGSAWLLARGGSGISSGVVGGQLGGSQAGIRVAYLLDRRHRIALAARLTAPLGPGLREGSVGVEWQPTHLPIRLVAEHRFAIGAGHGGPGVAIVGGAGPVPLAMGFRLDGYGQAGAIKRDVVEGYVDGALHVAHPLAGVGAVRFDLGAGAWGAAQRGARRIDVGPSLGAVVPLGKQAVRLSLDWRERIAGRAAPGSGVALTIGADF